MGEIKTSLNIFKYRPTLAGYTRLKGSRKELIDYTIQNYLVSNPILRTQKWFRTINVKPKDFNLWMLSWNDIIVLKKQLADKDLIGLLKLMYGIEEKQLFKLDAYNVFACWKWVSEEMNKLIEIEIKELEDDIPDELKEAGIEQMERFDYAPALDKLAGGDITRYDEFLKLPYAKIFRKLVMDKVVRDITETYKENVSRKTKANSRNNL